MIKYTIVPVEATKEMIAAYYRANAYGMSNYWPVMLAARPPLDADMQAALELARDVYLRMRGKDAPRSDFEKVCVALLRANGEEVT